MDPITSMLNLAEAALQRIWPDANKRAEEMRRLQEIAQKGELARLEAEVKLLLAQIETNTAQAKHPSIFVAGPRPFVMWVGAVAFAYAAIIEPLARFVALLNGYDGEFPELNTDITLQVLLGTLGLGLMRSYDKSKGTDTRGVK